MSAKSEGALRGMPKDLAKEARRLRRCGWTVDIARSNHVHWRAPDGTVVVSALTPRSTRSVSIALRQLQRVADRQAS